MVKDTYKIKSKIWIYPGDAGWHFVTIPQKTAKEIDFFYAESKRGWGSLPVLVTLGKSRWNTSIFSDKKSGGYLLPIKKAIRQENSLVEKDMVEFEIKIEVDLD